MDSARVLYDAKTRVENPSSSGPKVFATGSGRPGVRNESLSEEFEELMAGTEKLMAGTGKLMAGTEKLMAEIEKMKTEIEVSAIGKKELEARSMGPGVGNRGLLLEHERPLLELGGEKSTGSRGRWWAMPNSAKGYQH